MVSDAEIAASNTKDVRHEVAVPPGFPFKPLTEYVAPDKPAREYPFVLDPFQKWSIACIERGESVLVSAHTSAGKTVIAECGRRVCCARVGRADLFRPGMPSRCR